MGSRALGAREGRGRPRPQRVRLGLPNRDALPGERGLRRQQIGERGELLGVAVAQHERRGLGLNHGSTPGLQVRGRQLDLLAGRLPLPGDGPIERVVLGGPYGLTLAETLGYDRVGFATHDAHASVIRQILHAWGLGDTVELPMDEHRVRTRMAEGVPEVVVQPVPEHEWLPRNERERVLARRHGDARLPSWVLYSTGAVLGPLMPGRPPSPPVPEPTLWGARHRVDTTDWP